MSEVVDVIIVSYNTRADLDACLSSLTISPSSHLGRTFVVDNASSDGTQDHVRLAWQAVTLIALDRNAGFAAANNAAMRTSTADLLLLLNSDTLVTAAAIDALVDRLRARGAVAVGPRLIDGRGRPEVSFGPMLSPWNELLQRVRVRLASRATGPGARYINRLVARERDVDWVSGACLLLDSNAVRAAGFFDERFFMYEEDVDLCASLRRGGGRILFTPAATVVHLRGRSQAGPVNYSHYDRSHLAFYQKHAPHWVPFLRAWLKVRGRSIR